MKDLDRCDMNDITDNYLARCMKNWASRNRPPAGGRERLLQAAANPSIQYENGVFPFMRTLVKAFSFGQPSPRSSNDWLKDNFSQSYFWSSRVATTWILAN